jgi:hypothetical protein
MKWNYMDVDNPKCYYKVHAGDQFYRYNGEPWIMSFISTHDYCYGFLNDVKRKHIEQVKKFNNEINR